MAINITKHTERRHWIQVLTVEQKGKKLHLSWTATDADLLTKNMCPTSDLC
jgi:hypothetical protein